MPKLKFEDKGAGIMMPLEELISKAREEAEKDDPPRDYIGASIIGEECERALFYGFRKTEPVEFPGRIHRRFDMGHWGEEHIIAQLRLAGFEIHCFNPASTKPKSQFRANAAGGLISGGMDGFIRGKFLGDQWHLLEAKVIISSKYERGEDGEPCANKLTEDKKKAQGTWWKVKSQGVKKAIPKHYAQCQLYMGLSHAKNPNHPDGFKYHSCWGLDAPLKRAFYVAMNSDTSQMSGEVIEYNAADARMLYRRALEVITADKPPERPYKSPDYPPCSWCAFKEGCHYGQPPARLCSTCKHYVIKLPGRGGNYSKRVVNVCGLHKRAIGEPCAQYQTWDQDAF